MDTLLNNLSIAALCLFGISSERVAQAPKLVTRQGSCVTKRGAQAVNMINVA